ncbi:unnamed protein product [Gongylonema pulchrum]|uniref:Dystrobrevin alpha n=1 Tax=Gongylonema pulchrum TaxID=637853 RepID=A0A183ERX2_9BILA|nr:unnamed protein product [Gongylonema pulchrum]
MNILLTHPPSQQAFVVRSSVGRFLPGRHRLYSCGSRVIISWISQKNYVSLQSSSSYTSSLSTASPQHSWSNSGTPRHQTDFDSTATLPPLSSRPVSRPAPSFHSPSSPAARQLAAELDELRRIGSEMQQRHDPFGNPSFSRLFGRKAASTLTLPRKKLSLTSSGGISGKCNGHDLASSDCRRVRACRVIVTS